MQADESDPVWLLIQVKTGQLERARRELERQGFELFCPRIRKPGTRSGPVPMLKSYAFVRVCDRSGPIPKLATTRGVHAVLGPTPHAPTQVRTELVEAIREKCDADGVFGFGRSGSTDAAGFLCDTEELGEEERGFLLLRHL